MTARCHCEQCEAHDTAAAVREVEDASAKPKCDGVAWMEDGDTDPAGCPAPVTHIDEKGYVYCTAHGIERRELRRCRKLRPHELRLILSGRPLARY